MKNQSTQPRFVVCVRNDDYELDLTLNKTYEVIPDALAEEVGWLRLVDETGEDYCYPENFFQSVDLSQSEREALLKAS